MKIRDPQAGVSTFCKVLVHGLLHSIKSFTEIRDPQAGVSNFHKVLVHGLLHSIKSFTEIWDPQAGVSKFHKVLVHGLLHSIKTALRSKRRPGVYTGTIRGAEVVVVGMGGEELGK
jgi:hypothetical protein